MPMMKQRSKTGVLLAFAAALLLLPGVVLADVAEFKSKMAKWVETRQLVSEERTEWESDRETLLATKQMLQQRRTALVDEIAALEGTSTTADDERRELLLERAEKFNSTATLVGETRPVENGQKVLVRTLYWGLGQAIYVNSQGELAGIGRPGKSGWVFTNDAAIADEAKLLLDIHEGRVDTIEFVKLPIEISGSF